MATIKDVAKLAGVALSTASLALGEGGRVSPATRQKVLEAARELNYQKNGFAMDLKRSQTRTIALILSDLSGPYFSELIQSVQDFALSRGYDLIACSSVGGQDSTAVKFLREKRVDGAIVLAHNVSNEVLQESAREGFPIVVLDRVVLGDYLINVLVDGEQGGYEATKYLIEQGHRRIAYISGPVNSYDNIQRYSGYQRALSEHALQELKKWNVIGHFTQEGGFQATKMLILQGDLPEAIFYANDEMALGGMKALAESGIRIPEQVSVIGYDDIFQSQYVQPSLTTIRQPKYEAGSMAAHLLFQALEGQFVNKSYKFSVELVERNSCAPSLVRK
ncbi:LacI family transcriptional regulator [Cohnella kolymensis]|uniref:LacI family transcriptional regulator n=1 Tax=Cohnella kolymensis TaxID=1590652 RepID=A0ABR5A0T4_9BACL|nr:LacI family DNA-binding transcriptional regulator [Cohnella kolymensis]KIL34298.1 LacI family transcriptional regulator [Cohnella kolymensis]